MGMKPPHKGRGALGNPDGRYNEYRHTPIDDDWEMNPEAPPLRTSVSLEHPRAIISRNRSPDIPFDRSINAYRGCEHGCIYCYARPTHAWLGLSPGLDFETRLSAKPDAAKLLRRELQAPGYRPRPIALGANTDPYQPIERQYHITRQILEVLNEFGHPCTITTKSAGVERDLDILATMAKRRLVHVNLSITTLRTEIARKMEPRASAPQRRLLVVTRLRATGIPVTMMVAPVIPVLTDPELESILEASSQAGAMAAQYMLVRLPLEVSGLFEEWLQAHFPDMAAHVMNRIRDSRGGQINDPRFGHRMRGQGVFADLIAQRFRIATRHLGLDKPLPPLDCSLFQGNPKQLSLF